MGSLRGCQSGFGNGGVVVVAAVVAVVIVAVAGSVVAVGCIPPCFAVEY